MPDWNLNITATGQEKAVRALNEVKKEMNEADKSAERQGKRLEQINKHRQISANLARQERKEAFERLSTEEKLLRLQTQRERIQERLVRAQGNELRSAALGARLAQTNAQIRGLTPAAVGGGIGGVLGRFTAGAGGALAGFLGPLAGFAGLAGIIGSVRHSLEQANRFKDIQEQFDLPLSDILKQRSASVRTGVSENSALGGVNAINMARAQALADPTGDHARIFSRYKISRSTLANEDVSAVGLGVMIRQALGQEGKRGEDAAYLKEIFGRGWQKELAIFADIANQRADATKGMEKAVETLNKAQETIDEYHKGISDGIMEAYAGVIRFFDVSEGLSKSLHPWYVNAKRTNPITSSGAGGEAPGIPAQRTADTGPTLKPAALPSQSGGGGGGGGPQTADALARIGLFVGGAGGVNSVKAILQQQDHKLGTVVSELKRLNSNQEGSDW